VCVCVCVDIYGWMDGWMGGCVYGKQTVWLWGEVEIKQERETVGYRHTDLGPDVLR